MATQHQIEANRLNAQKSTGPRTPQGKAASSQNAFKSGLDAESQFVIGESREEFAALQYEYFARFQPLTPEERFQMDTLLRNEWILRRLFRAEAHLWEFHTLRADRSAGTPLGEALTAGNEVFRRLQRRITLAERSYKDAFAELGRLQQTRGPAAAPSEEPQPQPEIADSPELASFRTPSLGPRPAPPKPPPQEPASSVPRADQERRLPDHDYHGADVSSNPQTSSQFLNLSA
jgi:hypothetical protein